jgi:hypothetical protein
MHTLDRQISVRERERDIPSLHETDITTTLLLLRRRLSVGRGIALLGRVALLRVTLRRVALRGVTLRRVALRRIAVFWVPYSIPD